jgi:LPS export ABC transporter protein LptC
LGLAACSFDYGTGKDSEKQRPDIVMENLQYARVRKGDLLARFEAEYAERWEESQTMELKNFTFEQLEDQGERVNVEGSAGAAKVQLVSGDIVLYDGVKIRMESEDLTIHTSGLEWKDKEKTLIGPANDTVEVQRSDGTTFTGIGFSAEIRTRAWTFSGEVKGSYVEKDEKENEEERNE